jgi:hypothetical protein
LPGTSGQATTQSAASSRPFWDKYEFLLSREHDNAHAEGKSINQHRQAETLIAINLPQFESRCRKADLTPPNMDKLKKLLRASASRKFVAANSVVNPPSGPSQRCWIFQQPKKAEDPII